MMQVKRVPLAWSARWRRIRLQAIPIACFVLAVGASGWLWQRQGGAFRGVGVVDTLRIDVTSPIAGTVVSLPNQIHGQWSLYDSIQAGDVLARFDDRQLQADKELLRQEIKQLIDKASAGQAESVGGVGAAARDAIRRAWENEQTQLSSMQQLLLAVTNSEPRETAGVVVQPPELPDAAPAATRTALAALREARQALEWRWADLERQAALLEVHAPISGTLVGVYCWPGQTVHPGSLIATIAADHGQHIVSYVSEGSLVVPQLGMQVAVRPRQVGARIVTSEIERVGHHFERIPLHHLQSPGSPQWGLPVRIAMPADAPLRPGALVDVMFDTAD